MILSNCVLDVYEFESGINQAMPKSNIVSNIVVTQQDKNENYKLSELAAEWIVCRFHGYHSR